MTAVAARTVIYGSASEVQGVCGEGKQGRFHMKGDIHVNRYSTQRLQREPSFHGNSTRESIHQRVFIDGVT